MMKQGQVRFLNEQEVKGLITVPKAFELVEQVFSIYAAGDAVNPIKLSLPIEPYHEGHINSMPSYIKQGDQCGVKVVSVHRDNMKKYRLPTTLGTILLHDPETGLPYAIMGGTHITDLRTGAVTGVMAKHLARADSKVLAVVGAGAQGFTSMEMTVLALPGLTEIRVCDLSVERTASFIERGKAMYPQITFHAADSARAMQGADVAIFATSAPVPILEHCEVSEGTAVICVSEKLTPKTIAMFDGFYVDFTKCAIERYNADGRRAAELAGIDYVDLTEEMVSGEIGDVILGKTAGRQNGKQRLLAASVGMSIEDVVCARHVFEEAERKNIGLVLDFQNG